MIYARPSGTECGFSAPTTWGGGRLRGGHQITAWHRGRVTNGRTEAVNNLIKRVKRIAFGFRRFRNYRIRALLYTGKPKWDLLATVTPR